MAAEEACWGRRCRVEERAASSEGAYIVSRYGEPVARIHGKLSDAKHGQHVHAGLSCHRTMCDLQFAKGGLLVTRAGM